MNVLGLGVTTPGSSSESCPLLRPFNGSAVRVVPEMTSPTVAVSVWDAGKDGFAVPDGFETTLAQYGDAIRLLEERGPRSVARMVRGYFVRQ